MTSLAFRKAVGVWILFFPLLLALGCAPFAEPEPEREAPEADLALVGVVPLDPEVGRAGEPSTVLLAGDRITAVRPIQEVEIPDNARQVELDGRYLLPGLWDLHVHLTLLDDHAPPLLVSQGVLGVRDMGGMPEEVEALAARIESGELLGPRVVRVGPTLNGAPNGPHHRVVETPEEAAVAVAELRDDGADLLKIHNATGRRTFFALLTAAEKAGLRVAGHVPKEVSPLEACAAGMGSIEHIATIFEGTYVARFEDEIEAFRATPEWLELEAPFLADCFAKHQTLFVPTLRTYEMRAHWAAEYDDPRPESRYLSEDQLRGWRENAVPREIDRNPEIIALRQSLVDAGIELVRLLHERGAPIGTGTDVAAPMPGLLPGFDLHAEVRLLAEAGMKPAQALRAATRGPGADSGGDPLQGRLVVGAPADLVLLGANAFEDLSALEEIEAVVLRGQLLDRVELDEILRALQEGRPADLPGS